MHVFLLKERLVIHPAIHSFVVHSLYHLSSTILSNLATCRTWVKWGCGKVCRYKDRSYWPWYFGIIHVFPFSEFSITSTILRGNQYYLQHLHRFLASAPGVGEDSSWLLCYNATSHGWKANTFHSKCDGKHNTVTIIQKDQYVFGGYTDIPWGKIFFFWCLSTFKRALVPRVFHWHLKILLQLFLVTANWFQ